MANKKPMKIKPRDLRGRTLLYRPGTRWFTNGDWILTVDLWDPRALLADPKGVPIRKAGNERWEFLVTVLERPYAQGSKEPCMGGRNTAYRRTPVHVISPKGECLIVYLSEGGGILGLLEGNVDLIAARAAGGLDVLYAPAVPAGEWYLGFASCGPGSGLDVGTHTMKRPDLGLVLDVAQALLSGA